MCKKELDVIKFKTNKRKKDGLQCQCIECQRAYRRKHYLENKEKYIKKARVVKDGFRKWWKDYKKNFKCMKCGESHPACIQFHHYNDDKELSVSTLVQYGCRKNVFREIEKCVPLCANCHAKEHWRE